MKEEPLSDNKSLVKEIKKEYEDLRFRSTEIEELKFESTISQSILSRLEFALSKLKNIKFSN